MNVSDGIFSVVRQNRVPFEIIVICDIVMAISSAIGIFGNITVALCILRKKSLRTYINAHLVSSSTTNVVGCLLLIPLRIYLYSAQQTGQDAKTLCEIIVFIRTFCESSQLFMLCIMSFEKYQCVAYPFKKEGQKLRTTVFISLSWAAALILSLISTFVFVDSALYDLCFKTQQSFMLNWGYHDAFLLFPLGVTSLIIIFVFYGLIIRTLYKHSAKMSQHSATKKNKVSPSPLQESTAADIGNSTVALVSDCVAKGNQHKINEAALIQEEKKRNIDQRNGITKQKQETPTFIVSETSNLDPPKAAINKAKKNLRQMKYQETETSTASIAAYDPSIKSHSNYSTSSFTVLQKRPASLSPLKKICTVRREKSEELSTTSSVKPKAIITSATPRFLEVKAYDIDGTVSTLNNEHKHFAGNVCVMNSKNREQGKRRVEVKAAKRIAILIGGFLLCWLPLPLLVVTTLAVRRHSSVLRSLLIICSTVGTTATAVNPILHALLNRQLKTAIIAMLKVKRCFTKT